MSGLEFVYKIPESEVLIPNANPLATTPLDNLSLVAPSEEILRTSLLPFDFKEPPVNPVELAHRMVRYMRDHNGLGLSANQLGLPFRAFAMVSEPNFVCFNPFLVGHGEEEEGLEEGCLTYPGLFVKVKRWKSIKVRFTMPNGEVVNKTFAGMTARIFQHELDHLNGEIPLGKTSRITLQTALEKARKKYRKNYRLKDLLNVSL